MLVLISPAKRLDWAERDVEMTAPDLQSDAVRLSKTAKNLTLGQLRKLMDLSPDLARLNRDRFQAFETEPSNNLVRPAALAFAGDTYQGLEATTFSDDEMRWAQDHLRILSGLYGLLRPLDAIQPYRLEMGSRLKTRRGASLYDYWRTDLSKMLNTHAEVVGTDTLINCASQEYFGAVAPKALKLRVITPIFMELKDGNAKIVSFFAKKARGAMARYIVQNRIENAEEIKSFHTGGYAFQKDMSEGDRWVFLRDYPA